MEINKANLDNEKWFLYRKTDQHLVEYIVDQDGQIVCWMQEKQFEDSIHEDWEIEMLELKSKLIAESPDMFNLLKKIIDSINSQDDLKQYKRQIETLINKVTI